MSLWTERRLIERIRRASNVTKEGLLKSIGDDCCEVSTSSSFLISTDSLIDSVHFDRSFHRPHLLGRKSIAVNLSDIAAMGGKPRFALLALALPADLEWEWISSWLDGALEILGEYGCVLIGGDTVKSKELSFTVTILGEPAVKTGVYRNGAQPGDTVWVSGSLGSAGAGLELLKSEKNTQGNLDRALFADLLAAHLNPVPQIPLGNELAQSGLVTSMLDISDGLATDLAHICEESGVSARIDAERLPCLSVLHTAAEHLGMRSEDFMLRAGEDYQLLFTIKQGSEGVLWKKINGKNSGIKKIGEIQSGKGVFLQTQKKSVEISFQGYEH